MKNLKLTILFLSIALLSNAQTSQAAASTIPFSHIVLGMVIIIFSLILFLLVFVLKVMVDVLKKQMQKEPIVVEVDDRTTWEKFLSLKPLSAEKNMELDHDFDGIKELNNPIPYWFNALFYGTIVIGITYFFVYHVFDMAPLQAAEYEIAMNEAEVEKAEYVKRAGNLVDESTVKLITDKTKFAEGVSIYTAKCAVCHGANAEGKVGPNLTDEYWIHGGDVQSIFKTIKYGVAAKGMVAWQNSLNGGQIQQLASYVLSLQGTKPAGAKEPQGEKVAASQPDSTQVNSAVTDTTITAKN
jgi:cytochrome c oxidase cbb3-type subunit 3